MLILRISIIISALIILNLLFANPLLLAGELQPNEYGVYLYQNRKFVKLIEVPVHFSDISYRTASAFTYNAATFVNKEDYENKKEYHYEDYLVLYYPDISKHDWYMYPITYFPEASYEGNTEADFLIQEEGYYLGIYTIDKDLTFGCKVKSINLNEYISYSDNNILYFKLRPLDLPVTDYIITKGNINFNAAASSTPVATQIPSQGYLLKFSGIKYGTNHIEALKRINIKQSKKYSIEKKEMVLQDDSIINSGLYIQEDCFVKFVSDNNFRLVLESCEWDVNGFRPFKGGFRKDYVGLSKSVKSHRVQFRNFYLRYTKCHDKDTEIKLQGIKPGTKVTIIYNPSRCFNEEWYDHLENCYELINEEKYGESLKELKIAKRISPDNPEILNGFAYIHAISNGSKYFDPELALKYALSANKFLPRKSYILDTLSLAYFINGDLTKAIEYERQAYGDWYKKPDIYKKRMNMYTEIQKHIDNALSLKIDQLYSESIKELNKALALMPNCFIALCHLSEIYMESKNENILDSSKALDYAKKAYEIADHNAYVNYTLSRAYYNIKDKNNAIKYIKDTISLEPKNEIYNSALHYFKTSLISAPVKDGSVIDNDFAIDSGVSNVDFMDYASMLRIYILRNWNAPSNRPKFKEYNVVATFQINSKGEIKDIILLNPSKWKDLNDSIVSAINKCSGKLELPKEFEGDSIRVQYPFILPLN